MKRLHKQNLFCWSEFDNERNIDFHSYLWIRDAGNIVIDPLPISDHNMNHLLSLGNVTQILLTNSDHARDAENLAHDTGAEIWGPAKEREGFPLSCSHWLEENYQGIDGLKVISMGGSKTPGELAFLLEENTLITGDLIRAHEGGKLCLLPDSKLVDKIAATASIRKLLDIRQLEAILTGDGWPVFRDGWKVLSELVESLENEA